MSEVKMSEVIKNRYEFSVLFDVENGNPNGDPDADNMPRIDQETNHGLVTDVCLKRKIRNYIETACENREGYDIYVKENVPLQDHCNKALEEAAMDENGNIRKDDPDIDKTLKDFMCRKFFDIRAFGAVITTFTKLGLNCGQIRGPIQLGFAKSIDPIMPQEITITRLTGATDKQHTIGRKFIVPYALYRVDGYISASLAKVTNFNEDDLKLFWKAILNMFEHDHSATRGKMAVRNLIVFKHESIIGNAPAHKLFDLVKVSKKDKVIIPRSYQEAYVVSIDKDACPNGVTITEMA